MLTSHAKENIPNNDELHKKLDELFNPPKPITADPIPITPSSSAMIIKQLDNPIQQQTYISSLFAVAVASDDNNLMEDIVNNHIQSLTIQIIKDYFTNKLEVPVDKGLIKLLMMSTTSEINRKLICHYLIQWLD